MVLLTMTAPIVEALKLKNNLELRTEITQSKTELLGQATSSSTSDLDVLKLSSDAQKAREAGLDVDSTFLGHSGDIKEAGLSAPEEEDGLQPTEPSLLHPAIGMPISHGQIIDLSTTLRSQGHTSYTLEKLLPGSKVFIPPPPPEPEQTFEYKILMARLRREAEARSYTQMTSTPTPETFSQCFPHAPTTSPAHAFSSTAAYMSSADTGDSDVTYADIDKQMAVIFNVLISIVACAAAIWIAARWWNTPVRLAASMGGGGLVGIAECVVYWGYIRRVGEAKKEEGKKKEVREVVGTWVFGGDQGDENEGGSDVSVENEEEDGKHEVRRRLRPKELEET